MNLELSGSTQICERKAFSNNEIANFTDLMLSGSKIQCFAVFFLKPTETRPNVWLSIGRDEKSVRLEQ